MRPFKTLKFVTAALKSLKSLPTPGLSNVKIMEAFWCQNDSVYHLNPISNMCTARVRFRGDSD